MATTVPYDDRVQLYQPVSSTSVFLGTFPLFVDTLGLAVYVDGVALSDSAYTITSTFDNGRADVWSVTLDTPVSGVDVLLVDETLPKRDDDFIDGQPDLVLDTDVEIDRSISLHQLWHREFGRTRRLPISEYGTNYILPAKADRAGLVDGYDGSGNPTLINPNFTSTTVSNVYDTRSDMQSATIDVGVKVSRVLGYTTAGDVSEMFFKRVNSEPSHEGKIRSTDRFTLAGATDATNGGWWEYYSFVVRPEHFGALGAGADDKVQFQNAEGAAFTLGLNMWITRDHLVSGSILKFSNVDWTGGGNLKHIDYATQPTVTATEQWPLLFCDGVADFSIDDIGFYSLKHSVVISAGLGASGGGTASGNTNSCIATDACSRFNIRNCRMVGFSQGIWLAEATDCQILDNYLDDESGLTVASMIAGTYTKSGYSQSGTFGIGNLFNFGAVAYGNSERYRIAGNTIKTPGSDIGIYMLAHTFEEHPGIITENFIYGAGGAGIQMYRGFTETGSPTTYDARAIISKNYIYGTWEQGIYIRGVSGVLIDGNMIKDAAKIGTGGAGSSAGAIVTRINPFAAYNVGTFISQASVTNKTGIDITNNKIIDPGSTADCDGAIQARVDYCHITNNVITRDETVYTTKKGTGIVLDNNEDCEGIYCEHNRIYNFELGVLGTGSISRPNGGDLIVGGNHIDRVDQGISLDSFNWNGDYIHGNNVSNASTHAIRVRNAPQSIIEHNIVLDSTIGIEFASGNLASNIPHLMTSGSTPGSVTKRQGATLTVRANSFHRVTTPHNASEGATGDGTFQGRCAIWEGDMVDGRPVDGNAYSSAAWTNQPRSWSPGDIIRNTTIAAATLHSSICTVAGTGGTNTVSTTCNTTSGDNTVDTIADWDGIGPGMYIDIAGTVHYITSVDPAGDEMEVDPAPGATATGAALTDTQPTFVNHLTNGAT